MKNQIKKTSLVAVLLAMLGGNAVFAQSTSPTPAPTAEPTTAPAQNVIEGDIVAHASEKDSKREVIYTSDAKNNRANFYLIDAAGNPALLKSIHVSNTVNNITLKTGRYKMVFTKNMFNASADAYSFMWVVGIEPMGLITFFVLPISVAMNVGAGVPALIGALAFPIDAVITGISALVGPGSKAEHSFKDLLLGNDSELSQRAFGKLVNGLQKL